MTKPPDKPSWRKAKVFGDARKRIERTDIKLGITERDRNRHENRANSLENAFKDPIVQKMGEDLHKILAYDLAEGIAEEIKNALANDPEMHRILTGMALHKMAQKTGETMAEIVCEMVLPEMKAHVHADANMSVAEEAILTRITMPVINRNVLFAPWRYG